MEEITVTAYGLGGVDEQVAEGLLLDELAREMDKRWVNWEIVGEGPARREAASNGLIAHTKTYQVVADERPYSRAQALLGGGGGDA